MSATITVRMRLVMTPFVTPLVRSEEDGAMHIGSGGYVETAGRKLLLTNDHVFRDGLGRLTHKFYDHELLGKTRLEQIPVDFTHSLHA
jgi:hypothetical protein